MCLAIPAQVLSIDSATDQACVSLDGVRKEISLALVDGVEVGDYVLVHVGYALNRISPEEAEETLRLMRALGALDADAAQGASQSAPDQQPQPTQAGAAE
ncbi:Hydrogenase isoenzymes formation protein HypC [Thiorhodovibrio winogradskyi]|uniref:Hydrogenase isoenzymes formation protein HypC n=1 Tax=Thiorhodovibrio winogradskyi TaxID=77007 RepID=A0ABZ0S7P4_9GAMM|nr:HypC/HybG/HupF family hydrogenase formation chaperone [Thiorhodovibrio winogradskyi]